MRKLLKYTGRAFLALPVFVAVYWLLITFPQMFFRLEKVENLYLYHHSDGEKVRVAGERALAKIKRSNLYDPASTYRVFLTSTSSEYAFFTSLWRGSGGVFLVFANGNIFIRPSLVDEDRLIAPTGETLPADRPLNYFIAHETAHAMVYDRVGFTNYNALQPWIREGVADKIARDSFDYERMRGDYRSGQPALDPRRSGLYLKYQLMVEYALRHQNFEVESLLEKNPPGAEIEEQLKTENEK